MRCLVSNDDGLDAPGIAVLEACARAVFDEVIVVAPATEMSAASHGITIHDLLRVHDRGGDRHAVSGTPADCVLYALGHVMASDLPDLVVSGINRGPNLGWDVYYSGTVGAAREAQIKGIPAVAFSLVGRDETAFEAIAPVITSMLIRLRDEPLQAGTLLNVNLPEPSADLAADGVSYKGVGGIRGLRTTQLGQRSYSDEIIVRRDPRGRPYVWIGGSFPEMEDIDGTDCTAVMRGFVSVTPLELDTTDFHGLHALRAWTEENHE